MNRLSGVIMRASLMAVMLAAAASGAMAAQLTGPVAAYADPSSGDAEDLDSIRVGGERVRLINIDNRKLSNAKVRRALAAIEEGIGGRQAICEIVRIDSNGRHVGTCRIGSTDIGALFVSRGWAVFE